VFVQAHGAQNAYGDRVPSMKGGNGRARGEEKGRGQGMKGAEIS